MKIIAFVGSLDPIALWGAVLSTLLASVKFYEIWQARTQIEVSYSFTSNPEIGNEVIIRNLSNKPILITYWELFWQHRNWGKLITDDGTFPDYDYKDKKLDAHSSTSIHFAESDHFGWGAKALGKNKIFIHLHIAGKNKPIRKKVYG